MLDVIADYGGVLELICAFFGIFFEYYTENKYNGHAIENFFLVKSQEGDKFFGEKNKSNKIETSQGWKFKIPEGLDTKEN